jgi:hypothetical protein
MSDKPRKERTEAQKRATASMLNKLKENREKGIKTGGRKKKEIKNVVSVDIPEPESESEEEVSPKERVVVKEVIKEVPIEPKYLTREDLHAFKNELASLIHPPPSAVQEKPMKPKKKLPVNTSTEDEDEYVPPQPVRTVAPKAPRPAQPSQSLTGYSLLDKLLNR